MEAADDMKLGDGFRVAGGRCFPCLFECHGVAGGIAFLAAKGAELAGSHADVRRVDVAIDVEVGKVAVHPLADMVGQPAYCQHIRRGVKREAVVSAEALLGHHPGGDRLETRVIRPKGVGRNG